MKKFSSLKKPAVVATVHDEATLQAALTLTDPGIDALEIRVDGFPDRETWLQGQIARLQYPLIITVRHPQEGAIHKLKVATRKKHYQNFFQHACAIDMELRSVASLAATLRQARELGIGIILSHHDFASTPPLKIMRQLARQARLGGADVFKIATTIHTPEHLGALHQLVAEAPCPISAMGMGPMGKISRLLLAHAGSVLNYGYLCKPQIIGQWPATILYKRMQELSE